LVRDCQGGVVPSTREDPCLEVQAPGKKPICFPVKSLGHAPRSN
jgi:hypothetical protein